MHKYEVLYETTDQPTMYRVVISAHSRREAIELTNAQRPCIVTEVA